MGFYVYILQSGKDGRFYIGQTSNLEQRLDDHNKGHSRYTRNFTPWELKYFKRCQTRSEAIALERKLKGLKSRDDLISYAINHLFTEY
ncbi:MAG: GIY-YIG nuclease family protein [Bacteroidota bacterium]